jgi:hypothetical protein
MLQQLQPLPPICSCSYLNLRSRSTFNINGGRRGSSTGEEERKRDSPRNTTTKSRFNSVRGMFLKSLTTETQKFCPGHIATSSFSIAPTIFLESRCTPALETIFGAHLNCYLCCSLKSTNQYAIFYAMQIQAPRT